MNLNDSLLLIAMQLQLDPNELIGYANEDTISGYHWQPEKSKWRQGSIWEVEGKTIYALIRALKPQNVVEIGSWVGCSATHIATALSVNGSGHVTAVDIDPQAGESFPAHLASVRTTVTSDGISWLAGQEDESIDLLFEDSSHDTDMCASIAALCKTKLAPGGVMLMHDAAHSKAIVGGGAIIDSPVGAAVCAGLDRALGSEYRVYLAEPSDCGLAVYQRPKLPITERLKNTTWDITPIHEGVNPLAEFLAQETGLPSHLENDIPTSEAKNKLTNMDMKAIAPLPPGLRNESSTIEPLKAKKKPGRKPKSKTL